MEEITRTRSIRSKIDRMDERRKDILLFVYRRTAQLIIDALILAVLFTLLVGAVRVFMSVYGAVSGTELEEVFYRVLNDVMVVFIFVELFRVLVEYFKEERVKITYIADATIVFILKEIWVRFTAKSVTTAEALAMVAVLLAVGAIRLMAVWRSPGAAPIERECAEKEYAE